MATSTKKSKKQKIRKVILIAIGVISAFVFFSMAFAAYNVRDSFSTETYLSNDEAEASSTPKPTSSPTEKPSPTPRKAFIPDPDELKELPDIEETEFTDDVLEGEFDEDILQVSWEVVEDADYYVLCAMNDDEQIYHTEILWPDISKWMIPEAENGNIYLFCYEDMGEDSAEDDELIAAFSLNVEVEQVVVAIPSPTKKPTPTNDNDDDADENDEDDEDEVLNKYYIIVDKEDFTFAAFTYDADGEYTILVRAFPTAIGRTDRMTPNGVFEISSKGEWKTWSSGSVSPYYTRFTSGLYFHGAVYGARRGDAMYKSYYNGIGTAASSGCLRTTYEAAMWVYYNCPAGTKVEIVSSSDKVNKVVKPPLDPSYPTWDPTDPNKPWLDPPILDINIPLKINEGSSAELTDLLKSIDDSYEDAKLVYKVVTEPVNGTLNKLTFTQKELDDGEVIYTHDDSETEYDSFEFIVTNKSTETEVHKFNIFVKLVDDDAPEIETNEWITLDMGDSCSLETALLAIDNEADPDEIVFTVTSMPEYGTIPETFTQEDILSGDVIYVHDGTETASDSFIFTVSDGTNTLEDQMFTITINIPAPDPTPDPTPEPT